MPLAFVTGGSGFLGRNFIPHLIGNGYSVRALYRSPQAKERILGALGQGPDTQGIELVEGDLSDLAALKRGMQGADVVFHCAAKAALAGNWREFERDNVEGTASVLAAAKAAGVRRLVHVSTDATCVKATAWGGLAALDGIDEEEPVNPPGWAPYSRTKARAEQMVLAANSTDGAGLETVVLRPHRIWGRGDTVILSALLAGCRGGAMRWFTPPPKTTTSHVLNVCHALLLAAQKGRPGQVYFVTDGVVLGTKDFFTRYVQAAEPELPIPQGTLPFKLAWWVATAMEAMPFLPQHPLLNRQTLAVMGSTVVVKDDKIRRELGFENSISVEDGLATVRLQ